MVSVPARRSQVGYAQVRGLSRRRACTLIGVARSALDCLPRKAHKDGPVLDRMRELSAQYPRYGYRRIAQSLEMIQKNNALNERAVVCVHPGNLPVDSIGNPQIQHSRQLSRINSPDYPGRPAGSACHVGSRGVVFKPCGWRPARSGGGTSRKRRGPRCRAARGLATPEQLSRRETSWPAGYPVARRSSRGGQVMGIALTLKQYLEDHNIDYEVMSHNKTGCSTLTAEASHIPGECLAKGVILRKDGGYMMAILPASRHVALAEVGHHLDQPVDLASEAEIAALFPDCDEGAVPAIARAYGLDGLVDDSLDGQKDIYIEGGDHRTLVHLKGPQFRKLMKEMPHAHISC
jgi:Ala-tRNA(Pro) deacylase